MKSIFYVECCIIVWQMMTESTLRECGTERIRFVLEVIPFSTMKISGMDFTFVLFNRHHTIWFEQNVLLLIAALSFIC